jgi:hypothetical protein
MQMKRIIVIVVSLLFGAVTTWGIIYTNVQIGPFASGFGANMKDFAYSNVMLLFISTASIAGIWLDYALGTEFLKR